MRKFDKISDHILIDMHHKRKREQEKIMDENKKIALRVINQGPKIETKVSNWSIPH
jgi:hypothetical protein